MGQMLTEKHLFYSKFPINQHLIEKNIQGSRPFEGQDQGLCHRCVIEIGFVVRNIAGALHQL